MASLLHTLTKARGLWHHDYGTRHAQMPLQVRQRTQAARLGPDGAVLRPERTQQYAVRPKPVPSTAKDLMSDLIFMSLRAVERRNRTAGSADPAEGAVVPAEAPALSVNCQMLGKRRSLSARTVRTHLARLQEMGAIARKAWHGTCANFELWINPKYLWESPETAGEGDLDATCLGALLLGESTKLPLNVAFVTLETQKQVLATSNGDKLTTQAVSANRPGCGSRLAAQWGLATHAGNTGPQLPGTARGPEINATPGAAGLPAAGDRPSPTQQRQWVLAFWARAQPRLYPGSHFTPDEHTRVLHAIWRGVYAGFGPGDAREMWDLIHAQALERIDLVADWLARHPGRYLPTPYATIVPGRGYFDAGNAHGFAGTREWLANKMHNQRAVRVEGALRRAAAELHGWRRRTAPARVLAVPLRQLIQQHQARITAFDDPAALTRFLRLASGRA